MTWHPRERPIPLARREFLRRSAAVALGLPAGAALLAACGSDDEGSGGSGDDDGGVKLSRPDDPATLPLHDDVAPIADGLDPESGTLKLYNYVEYNDPATLKAFEKEYGVKVEVTTFVTMDEAIAKLASGTVQFDVFFPTPDVVGKTVAGKLLQPLNPTYVPNLTNVWESLRSPFYDVGSRYTVPYTIYTTGIGYRTDQVDASRIEEGYGLLWSDALPGKTWVLDDDRETLSFALLRMGETDVNTEDPDLLEAAGAELRKLTGLNEVQIGVEAYSKLPEGDAYVHQCWQGDVVNAANSYLGENQTPDIIGYWFPPDGAGLIANDSIAVCAGSERPVLAHHFLNFMLDPANARTNYAYVGYQPPLDALDPDNLVSEGLVPENLRNVVVRPDDFDRGVAVLQLSLAGEKLWDDQYQKFVSG